MKRLLLVFVLLFGATPPVYGQNCGQGQTKKLYLFVALGMDEAQGDSQVEEDGRVINGYDFQYKMANLSDQWCGIELGFRLNGKNGIGVLKHWVKMEGGPILFKSIEGFDASVFSLGQDIRPWNRSTKTLFVEPGFASGLFAGWAEVRQDGNFERIVSVGTIRLYQNGEVVSQFSMKPVEAKLTNFVQVFAAERDSQRTGIAIGNPYFEEIKVTIQLINRLGVEIGKKEETLSKYGSFTRFINELFPIEQDADWKRSKVFEGVVKITASKEVPVTAIDGRVSKGQFLMSLVGAN